MLNMDLVVLGEFAEHYTARYVSDRLALDDFGSGLVVEHVEDAETARILADMGWATGKAGILDARSCRDKD